MGHPFTSGAPGVVPEQRGNRGQTVAALPRIIDGLRQQGYELVTVPELLDLD